MSKGSDIPFHLPDSPEIELSTGEIVKYEPDPVCVFSDMIEFGFDVGQIELFLEPDDIEVQTADKALKTFEIFFPKRAKWLDEAYDYMDQLLGEGAKAPIREDAFLDSITVMEAGQVEFAFTAEKAFDGRNIVVWFDPQTGFSRCWVEFDPEEEDLD